MPSNSLHPCPPFLNLYFQIFVPCSLPSIPSRSHDFLLPIACPESFLPVVPHVLTCPCIKCDRNRRVMHVKFPHVFSGRRAILLGSIFDCVIVNISRSAANLSQLDEISLLMEFNCSNSLISNDQELDSADVSTPGNGCSAVLPMAESRAEMQRDGRRCAECGLRAVLFCTAYCSPRSETCNAETFTCSGRSTRRDLSPKEKTPIFQRPPRHPPPNN